MSEEIKMSDVAGLLDEAITSVRDTNYHEVHYGEDGCDGMYIGILYSDVEAVIHETAEQIQQSHDRLTEENKRLREALRKSMIANRNAVELGIVNGRYADEMSEIADEQYRLLSELNGDNSSL